MELQQIKTLRDTIENNISYYTEQLNQFPRNNIGLIPDTVRSTTQYKTAKAGYDRWFKQLQKLNSTLTAKQKRQLRDMERERKQVNRDSENAFIEQNGYSCAYLDKGVEVTASVDYTPHKNPEWLLVDLETRKVLKKGRFCDVAPI